MKKVIFTILALTAALIVVMCTVPSVGTVFAADENYIVISPALDNYLYLTSPKMTAINGDTIAVYDNGAEKVFVAGGSHAQYDVDYLQTDEKVSFLAFATEGLYLLTDRSRLYNLTADVEIPLDNDVTAMASSDGFIYLYNSLRTIYRYDGTDFSAFSDSARAIFGSTSFTVSANTAYFYKDNKVFRLPIENGGAAEKLADITADTLLAAPNGVFTLSADGLTLVASDGSTFETSQISDVFPEANGVADISSDGENFAVLAEGDGAVYRYSSNGYTLSGLYGCAGNDVGWYNAPAKILATDDDSFTIWDKGNSRLDVYHVSDNTHTYFFHTGYEFTDYAGDSNFSFFTDGSSIFVCDTDGNIESIPTEYSVGAMCVADGKLYLYDKTSSTVFYAIYMNLTNNSVLTESGFNASDLSFKPLFVSYNTIGSMYASGGDVPLIYADIGSSIEIFSSIGKSNIGIELDGEISGFDVDAVGNVYTVKNTDEGVFYTKYTRTVTGFTSNGSTALAGDFDILGLNSFALLNDGDADCVLAIDSAKNLLVNIDFDYTRIKEYTLPTPVDINEYDGDVSYAKSKGTVIYSYADNYNNVASTLAVGDIVAVMDALSTMDALFVMTADGQLGYVAKTDTVVATPLTANGTVIALHDSVNVYSLPYTEATHAVFDKTQVFTLIDDCADFGDGTAWYKVSYSEGDETLYGYLLKSRVMSYTAVPVTEESVYAKAKATRLGATVNIYAMADKNSAVIIAVKDGTKLKLLDEYNQDNEFTRVEYEGTEGYVLTSELQLTGILTGGQIAAIVLASVTVLITGAYFFLSRRNRRATNNR